jgi:hypothetical protein
MTTTYVLDPATHTQNRTEFRLPSGMTVMPNIRLGGIGMWNPNAGAVLNSASGLYSHILAISLIIDGQTVCELRNAHQYLAYLAARRSSSMDAADEGDSVAQPLSFSAQKLVPYMQRAGAGPALGSTVITGQTFTLPITAATIESAHLYLWNVLPFLKATPVLEVGGTGSVIIAVEYIQPLSNVLPLANAGVQAATIIASPYLMFEEAPAGVTMPDVILYDALETDVIQVDAVADGAVQELTRQSRAFVGKTVSNILFCKSPANVTNGAFTGGRDASYAQKLESLRVWADGRQVTPLINNVALATSYGADIRAPVIFQQPSFYLFGQQSDPTTENMLGARHYISLPAPGKIEQSRAVDYARTGYSPAAPPAPTYDGGIAALNLIMYATLRKVMTRGKGLAPSTVTYV